MTHRIILLIIACLGFASSEAVESGKHIFILSGQSNIARLKPSESFTPAVHQQFGKENCVIIHQAASGKAIRWWYRDWKPASNWKPRSQKESDSLAVTEDYSKDLVRQYQDAARGQKVLSVTLVWMQGESDGLEGHGAVYEQSLAGFVAQMVKDTERPDLHVVIGRISDFGTTRNNKEWDLVREAQVRFAQSSPLYGWIDTDDLNDGVIIDGKPVPNDLHYAPEAYKTLGMRFAEKAIDLIVNPPKPTKKKK